MIVGYWLAGLAIFSAHLLRAEVLPLEEGWLFHLASDGVNAKGEEPPKDVEWRTVSLPHDWAFEGPYRKDAAQGDRGGYKPGGLGWYRRTFEAPEEWERKTAVLSFDGVYMNATVWVNGQKIGFNSYGYIPFEFDVSRFLQAGENTVLVRVDNTKEPSARWYHGCGIYAPARIDFRERVHVPTDGIWLQTPSISSTHSELVVRYEVHNSGSEKSDATAELLLFSPKGVALSRHEEKIPALEGGETRVLQWETSISNPSLWSPENPERYRVQVRITSSSEKEEVEEFFGIRSLEWSRDTGFSLNGEVTKFKGVADHLEAGPVGMAYPEELLRWKLQLLKDMGCNAIRTAHNPQIPQFYDLCDEMGLLVMDEIFDGWGRKAKQDYGAQSFKDSWKEDLTKWIRSNRNHPSIVIWSVGNETHGEVGKELVARCHELDPTRLVTSGGADSKFMDVVGINGPSERPKFFDKPRPSKPFVATEAPHTWQVRGYYRTQTWYRDGQNRGVFTIPNLTPEEVFTYDWTAPDNKTNRKQIFNSSYDNATVRITARQNWELMRDLPWFSGHFRWTGFDYLGEAGYVHGGWPFRAFMGGALDLAGFEKDLYYFYQSQWTDEPMVHLLPHWTHPRMKEGTKVPVWAYSNAEEVALYFNGKLIGRDRPETHWAQMQCEWLVPWQSGELLAIAYEGGKEVARTTQRTAGAPQKLSTSVAGENYPIVTVDQVDKEGTLNPYGECRVYYHVEGEARILSLESGNPVNTDSNWGVDSRTTFFGKGRCFLARSGEKASLAIAAILGDKALYTSSQVAIDVQWLDLAQGNHVDVDVMVEYSLDGGVSRIKYTEPFTVSPGTNVLAWVIKGDEVLFEMSERFGPDEGLHWLTEEELATKQPLGGDQAEDATLSKAQVKSDGEGFRGKGYVDFGNAQGAFVEWYQENDGAAGPVTATIRYSGKRPSKEGSQMSLQVNGEKRSITLPNTKAWRTDWKTIEVKISLRSGANRIRLTTLEKGGMLIDELSIK